MKEYLYKLLMTHYGDEYRARAVVAELDYYVSEMGGTWEEAYTEEEE